MKIKDKVLMGDYQMINDLVIATFYKSDPHSNKLGLFQEILELMRQNNLRNQVYWNILKEDRLILQGDKKEIKYLLETNILINNFSKLY